jgi:hypothetical protein
MQQITPQDQKVCFVVMGFGKKTDYETGRTLDLDASYEAIIKPAVTNAGLRCIRADEVMHSGVIDEKMYDMLLKADLVVADLSTSNANALYELGVRHALKPYATILIKEQDGRLHFDLNHVVTMQYQHLGADIGTREARLKEAALREKIIAVMKAQGTDSPVYTYIPGLEKPRLAKPLIEPRLSMTEFKRTAAQLEATHDQLAALIKKGEQAGREGRYCDGADAFASALEVTPKDAYLRQQLALHTYKSKQPSERAALEKAWEILAPLDPGTSTDPETLGISGAIHKRLFGLTKDPVHLDEAIRFYGRGFAVRGDYYSGENLATCLDLGAVEQQDPDERLYDRLRAKKTREELMMILDGIQKSDNFDQRSDQKWVFATRANVAFALGDNKAGAEYEKAFIAEQPAGWELETYEAGKKHALSVAAGAPASRA